MSGTPEWEPRDMETVIAENECTSQNSAFIPAEARRVKPRRVMFQFVVPKEPRNGLRRKEIAKWKQSQNDDSRLAIFRRHSEPSYRRLGPGPVGWVASLLMPERSILCLAKESNGIDLPPPPPYPALGPPPAILSAVDQVHDLYDTHRSRHRSPRHNHRHNHRHSHRHHCKHCTGRVRDCSHRGCNHHHPQIHLRPDNRHRVVGCSHHGPGSHRRGGWDGRRPCRRG